MLQILIIFTISVFIISLIFLIPLYINQKQIKKYKNIELEYKNYHKNKILYKIIKNHNFKLSDNENIFINSKGIDFYKIKNNRIINNLELYKEQPLFTLKENFNFQHINYINIANNCKIYVSNIRIVIEDKKEFFIYFYKESPLVKISILKIDNEYKKGIIVIDKKYIYFLDIKKWDDIFMINGLYKKSALNVI